MSDIPRIRLAGQVERALRRSRAVAIVGPRQCGKTTLARVLAGRAEYFDLENPADDARLRDPWLTLEPLRGLVAIDEVQRRPDLLPVLRVLLDRRPLPARFLLLGSASPELMRGASESLAGRVEFVEMGGFTVDEIGGDRAGKLWLRGGFPRSTLARSEVDSLGWRESFLRALAERDLRVLGVDLPPAAIRRFLTMIAHYHGQTWNGSEVGRSMQMAHTTVRRYLDLLTGARILRQLSPWFENVGKRVVKAPKVYVRDSGLLHALLGIGNRAGLESNPKLGASWEGFALENVLAWVGEEHAYFWATHGGAEMDLCVMRGAMRIGMEFKHTSAPSLTRSMTIARNDLRLRRVYVVHPGDRVFALDDRTVAVGINALAARLKEDGVGKG